MMMKLTEIAAATFVFAVAGCSSLPPRPPYALPTLQDARAGVPNLKRGMTVEEASVALGIPDFSSDKWRIWCSAGGMGRSTDLWSRGRRTHSLDLYFVSSLDGREMHLASWSIKRYAVPLKDPWKTITAEAGRGE